MAYSQIHIYWHRAKPATEMKHRRNRGVTWRSVSAACCGKNLYPSSTRAAHGASVEGYLEAYEDDDSELIETLDEMKTKLKHSEKYADLVNRKPVNLQASTITPLSEIKVKAEALTNVVESNIIPITKAPHDVSEHIRNLPQGYKASAEKIALAAERGLVLLPEQTIVDAYRAGGAVA